MNESAPSPSKKLKKPQAAAIYPNKEEPQINETSSGDIEYRDQVNPDGITSYLLVPLVLGGLNYIIQIL